VYIERRIHTAQWEDAETGPQRSGIKVVIHEMIMLDGRGTTPVEDTAHPGTPAPEVRAAPFQRSPQHGRAGTMAPASSVHDPPRRHAIVTPDDDLPL
jgi:single-stranded DNA-binding protein